MFLAIRVAKATMSIEENHWAGSGGGLVMSTCMEAIIISSLQGKIIDTSRTTGGVAE